MYDFSTDKNKKLLESVVIILDGTMLHTNVIAALL